MKSITSLDCNKTFIADDLGNKNNEERFNNLKKNTVGKFTKLNKIGFSLENFRFSLASSATVKIFPFISR